MGALTRPVSARRDSTAISISRAVPLRARRATWRRTRPARCRSGCPASTSSWRARRRGSPAGPRWSEPSRATARRAGRQRSRTMHSQPPTAHPARDRRLGTCTACGSTPPLVSPPRSPTARHAGASEDHPIASYLTRRVLHGRREQLRPFDPTNLVDGRVNGPGSHAAGRLRDQLPVDGVRSDALHARVDHQVLLLELVRPRRHQSPAQQPGLRLAFGRVDEARRVELGASA